MQLCFIWINLKGVVKNSSMSLSHILVRNDKVEHYLRIKTHELIVLRFWIESGVNVLYS